MSFPHLSPTLRRLVRLLLVAAFFATCLLVVALALGPPPQGLAPGEDKVQHFLAFAALTSLGLAAFRKIAAGWIATGLLAGGVGIELLQAMPSVHRDCSVGDVLADATGIAAGLAFVLGCRLGWRALEESLRRT